MGQNSLYHSALRISILVSAVALLFVSGLVSDVTSQLSEDTRLYLSSVVGASASVEPTELNTYTAQLTSKERDLEAREMALLDREINVGISNGVISNTSVSTYVLSGVLFILLVLILLNYTLDYLRIKEERSLFVPKSIKELA